MDVSIVVDYVVVAALGLAVGIGELVARYRDEPVKALSTWAAGTYVAVNALASIFALAAIDTFGWFSADPPTAATNLTQVLVAGFGAMAVFRSSLFVVRVGNDDVGVGPVAFLQVILGASDRGVDRRRGVARAARVVEIMKGLTFDKAATSLPLVAMALLQNPDRDDAETLGKRVKALRDSTMPDSLKLLNLGLATMDFVGEDVLQAAATALRSEEAVVATGDARGGTIERPGSTPKVEQSAKETPGTIGETAVGTGIGAAKEGEDQPS